MRPGRLATSARELAEAGKRATTPLPYASGGNGSENQLGIEMLKQRAGIDMLHVPYRGGAPAGMATVAGETMVVLAGATHARLLKSRQVRRPGPTRPKGSPRVSAMPPVLRHYPRYGLTDLPRLVS